MTAEPEKTVCGGCRQGSVLRVRVKSTGAELFVCDECETTWLTRERGALRSEHGERRTFPTARAARSKKGPHAGP